ncbi:hydrolase 2, exosortase A system-associated [Parahaliea sp. F7430]|uniref:Hydrolase 2, exosortase A system-associated n=1 Tax=Sediminihaliea albiluteola TaxID=2758564 RepID=A0A7W2TVI1_9GAMM|nr:hydrolase 2, exosortase A system-associated [Sediminihaliea albiluteola]MBA6412690.1 hydrolase 2, exosortase A system-associated [Sediminihaliea albiluteola]
MKTSAQFIGATGQQIFTLSFQPESAAKAQFVYVPPFAEEMNRCRSWVAGQSRQLAQRGYGCTLFDFRGTGDSDGELINSSLASWFDDMALAVTTVEDAFQQPVILWGLRSGALLAWHYTVRHPAKVDQLLLWQPVLSGQNFVRQLIRQRIAAGLGRERAAESSDQIKAQWLAGQAVEIAGYPLGGELMVELQSLEITPNPASTQIPVTWLEHVSEQSRPFPIPTAKLLDKLKVAGHSVNAQPFCGPAIWQLNERDENFEIFKLMGDIYS